MSEFQELSPYLTLVGLAVLMLLGSISHITELVVFSAGAALPVGHLCWRRARK